jgi:hypothetical protein
MSAAALTRMLRYRLATADESKKESITFVILSFAWCHQESNRGHKDFQSFALPTELWHLAFVCECKGIANFITVQIFLIKFLCINEGEIAKKAAALSHCNLIVANYFTSSILGLGLYLRPALAQSLPSTLTISAV